MMNQPLSPKDERNVSTNPSADAAITGPSRNASDPPRASDAAVDNNTSYPPNNYGSLEQTYFYGGYDSGAGSWSGYTQYAGEGLHVVPPVIYGDNSSLGLHSPYGFNSQMAYGQYSPASTPVPQIMVDNQLYSPQQIPVSPQYYPQQVGSSMPHMSAPIPVSHAEMVNQKGHMSMNALHNHGYYNLHGMYGSGEPLSSPSNSTDVGWRTLNSTAYSAALGSFDPTVGQMTQQRPYPGYGLVSDYVGGPYHYDGSFQNSNYSAIPNSQSGFSNRNRYSFANPVVHPLKFSPNLVPFISSSISFSLLPTLSLCHQLHSIFAAVNSSISSPPAYASRRTSSPISHFKEYCVRCHGHILSMFKAG